MTTNQFLTDPVRLVIYDPRMNKSLHNFVFLGNVPKNISAAITSHDHKTLKSYYGNRYKEKLGLDIESYEHAWMPQIAGSCDSEGIISGSGVAPNDNLDDIDLSDIEELLAKSPTTDTSTTTKSATIASTLTTVVNKQVSLRPGITYERQVEIFPEDKISELKEKIYLATDIPVYRQHLFYIDKNHTNTTYKIYALGLYSIDIRALATSVFDHVLGIPIDKFLYDSRSEIRVESLDEFQILGHIAARTMYVVDLGMFVSGLLTQLNELITDTYQYELFYYGFILKYWPQLTQECFYDYVVNEEELQHKYPDLAKNKLLLLHKYQTEAAIISNNYRQLAKSQKMGISIAITQMTAMISSQRVLLNIRNLFDKLRVTRCIPEIHAYVEHNNKKFLLRKRHIKNASSVSFPSSMLFKTGIIIAISLRKSDQERFHAANTLSTMENEQSRYMFLNIQPSGKYYIRTVWNEEDEYSFDDIIGLLGKFTDGIIRGINALGRYVFIEGKELPLVTKHNIAYQSLNICIYWKKVMLESTFKLVKALWEPYLRAGITGVRNVQQFDKYEFLFRKGMYDFDTSIIERIITASHNITLSNYYAHLSNNSIKQKWDQNYDGRIVRMTHRTTDIRFEIVGIHESEFEIFHNYIACFVYDAIHNPKIREASIKKPTIGIKKLRKLREQDPELYNLKKYGSKKVYSILCQHRKQPLIYTQDELSGLSQRELKSLTKYWNFTLNKPAYYGCPDKKYPHLSFIINSHPKHYCLPCCVQSKLSHKSKKNHVNSVCTKQHTFGIADYYGDESLSRHVMGYGKDVDNGRLSRLPPSNLKNLLFGTLDEVFGSGDDN